MRSLVKPFLSSRRLLKDGLRLSEIPAPRWWGKIFFLLKSLDVLLFKVLQMLDLYRPQKSILGIPSLASRGLTILQAIVVNGTEEEVLGFRPRRLIHRVLRGVPDVEMYERVRFALHLGSGLIRSIEASTETRGFIQLALPWQISERMPEKSFLRLVPQGVETAFGRFSLGDYEVTSAPVFFINSKVKWLLISDIDDTIKDTRIEESTRISSIIAAIFRGHFYRYEPVHGVAPIYQNAVQQGGLAIYLTSTPFQLAPFLLKFLKDGQFPEGPIFMRWLGYNRFGHKLRTLLKVLGTADRPCVLVGDSGEQDLQVYRRICEHPLIGARVRGILIRHVPGTPVQQPQNEKEFFFHGVEELEQILGRLAAELGGC